MSQCIHCKRVFPSASNLLRGTITDRWRSCNRLGDVGYAHVRVDHGCDEFVRRDIHINGIEAFRGHAKTRLARFRRQNPKTFSLHLKECEFRYNNQGKNMSRILLKICREKPPSKSRALEKYPRGKARKAGARVQTPPPPRITRHGRSVRRPPPPAPPNALWQGIRSADSRP